MGLSTPNSRGRYSNYIKIGLIGIDEVAIRKGYNDYLTIITSRLNDKVRIIAVLKGREKATVKAFLKQIPSRLKRTIEGICCDMNEGYINASLEVLKKVPVIVDRFHVAKKYRQCLVDIRKLELTRLRKKLSDERYKELKLAILILRRNQGASGLIIDFGTSKSAKIESLPSAVYSFGRHGSLSSRLRRLLRIFFAILLLYAFTAKTIASSTDLLWRLRHVARWE